MYRQQPVLSDEERDLVALGYALTRLDASGWDESALHDSFATGLGFPDYYRRNLNALADCLYDVVLAGATSAALLEANTDPRIPVLPPGAVRLAEHVLSCRAYADAPVLCRRWQAHADAIALVAPVGLPADDLLATINAVGQVPGASAAAVGS